MNTLKLSGIHSLENRSQSCTRELNDSFMLSDSGRILSLRLSFLNSASVADLETHCSSLYIEGDTSILLMSIRSLTILKLIESHLGTVISSKVVSHLTFCILYSSYCRYSQIHSICWLDFSMYIGQALSFATSYIILKRASYSFWVHDINIPIPSVIHIHGTLVYDMNLNGCLFVGRGFS